MTKATDLFMFLIVVFSHNFHTFSLNVIHNTGGSGFSKSACDYIMFCSLKVLSADEIQ